MMSGWGRWRKWVCVPPHTTYLIRTRRKSRRTHLDRIHAPTIDNIVHSHCQSNVLRRSHKVFLAVVWLCSSRGVCVAWLLSKTFIRDTRSLFRHTSAGCRCYWRCVLLLFLSFSLPSPFRLLFGPIGTQNLRMCICVHGVRALGVTSMRGWRGSLELFGIALGLRALFNESRELSAKFGAHGVLAPNPSSELVSVVVATS